MAAYSRALAIEPSYAPALRNLAVLLDLYMDDPVRALPYFEQYKAVSADDKQLNAWIADVRQRAGKAATPAGGQGGSAAPQDGASAPAPDAPADASKPPTALARDAASWRAT